MTTVSFMAELTAVSNWLIYYKWTPNLLLGWLCKTDQFRGGGLEVLLALCCAPHPSSNLTRKSLVGLNLAIVGGGTQHILFVMSIGREKCCQDRTWHQDGNVGVPRLVDTTCPHLHTADERREQEFLKHVEVRSTSHFPFKEEWSAILRIWIMGKCKRRLH
jgi:hypothetical protein